MHGVTAWVLVVYALAVMRVTGLITVDQLTATPRDAILAALPDTGRGHLIGYLITCPWCTSMWVSIVAVPLILWQGNRWWLLGPALALALSQITGMTATIGRTRA